MQFDNFAVRKCFDVTVQNPDGKPATGLAEYTLPYAVIGNAFELVLAPETVDYKMTVSCTMGGVDVPVTVNENGTVTIQIGKVSDEIVITVDSRKSAYDVTNCQGITNSNPAASVPHGASYTAKITSTDPAVRATILPTVIDKNGANGNEQELVLFHEFALVDQIANIEMYGGAKVTLTAFAIQTTGFLGTNGQPDTSSASKAWTAIINAYPYENGTTGGGGTQQ
jgi:hypothetical protein